MKKLFTLALLAILTVGANAQDKKTWDFTKGVSDETIADLQADANWTVTLNDDGSFKQANEAKKLSGEFKANGNIIKELAGLSLGTAGLSKNNNVILMPSRFRINRDKMQLNFPKLKGGQTITIVGRSANSSAENRGIKASFDYMVRTEGPEDNLIKASLGEVTNVWKVDGDAEQEYDIQFTMITGGVDFTLFMIDDGDAIVVSKVAYLYTGSVDGDIAYNQLKARENTEVTAIDVANQSVTAEELEGYTLTVIAASVPADNAAVAIVKESLPWTPTLNLNGNMYAAWGYGTAVEALSVGVVKDSKSAVLKGATIQEADGVNFIELAASNLQAVNLGEYFTGDAVPLKEMNLEGAEGEGAVVHLHNEKHNGYAYLPYAADVTDDWSVIFNNAVTTLAESKTEITPAAAPVVKQEFKDKNTNVTISAGRSLPKTQFFYTTDGSNPTVESTLYTETVNFTAPCTFKAVAIAEGYTVSEVTSLDILIHEQPKTPVIAENRADGKTTITLTCESADVDIWYNFSDAGIDTLKSTKYTEPIVITMPQNVTAFAVAGGEVFSELAQQRVMVQNPRVVIDVAGHFEARQWTADNNPDGKAVANGKGMFSWGASAATMYTGEGHIETDPETGDEKTVYGPEDMRDQEICNEPKNGENEPEWVLKSRGTCLIWQNLTPQNTNFGDDSNYNPSASTDVDDLFPITKNNIQFYKFQSGEPGNASIETINKYQAPLDVVVLANMQGGPLLVQVSADGAEWTTIGEIAKTGASRMWGKFSAAYDGSDEVYVRLTQTEASGGAKVFDIYIANQGEKSQALLEELNKELTGIETVADYKAKATMGIYNINGIRQQTLHRGLNIVVNGDGTVKKVMVK
jgi:hypothetical protein